MNDDRGGFSCTTVSWAMAAAAGVLTFVLLVGLGDWGFFGALFIGALVALGLGVLCQRVFCGSLGSKDSAKSTSSAGSSVAHARTNRQTETHGAAPSGGPVEAAAPAGASIVTPPSALAAEAQAEPLTAEEPRAEEDTPREPARPIPPSDPVPAGTPAPGAALDSVGSKPGTLDAPRDGKGDDLRQIKGIGPKLAENLNAAGFYHYDQIAAWSADEVAWVEHHVDGAKGRATRDDWVAQAKTLAGA